MRAAGRVSVILVSVLVGCGRTNDRGTDASASDGTPDAVAVGPNTIEIFSPSALSPALFMYQDGNGPWLSPEPISADKYNIHVTNAYQVLIVCASSRGFDAEFSNFAVADGLQQTAYCVRKTSSPTVAVTGQMVQPGTVSMQDKASSTNSNWAFALNVTSGVHDLIAWDSGEMLIRRDLLISTDTAIADIDVLQDGIALNQGSFGISNLNTDQLSTTVGVALPNGSAELLGASTTVEFPPTSVVSPGFMFLYVQATGNGTLRSADVAFDGSRVSFALMPNLVGATFHEAGGSVLASWSTLPSCDALFLTLASDATMFHRQQVTATKAWLDAMQASYLELDAPPPEYDPGWTIDISTPYIREFGASQYAGAIYYSTAVQEGVNGAVALTVDLNSSLKRLMSSSR